MSSDATASYDYETLAVTRPKEFVVQVELNRPEKRNAQTLKLYREMMQCFTALSTDPDCRAIVLSGAGKMFTAGIDIMDLAGVLQGSSSEIGRRGMAIRNTVIELQNSFSAIEKCHKPVIAAVHDGCIGGGVDMIAACDVRYASMDAYFQIKEVDVGLAADLGTLQRMPKVMGNDSLLRELTYTARKMFAAEAKEHGFISRIFPDREALIDGAIHLAEEISSKSPIAVQGSKHNLNYSRDHTVQDGLEYMITWNMNMLQSEDLMKAATAAMQKKKATFSKL